MAVDGWSALHEWKVTSHPRRCVCINRMWKDVWVAVKVNMRGKMMRMTAVSMGQEILEIFCSHLSDIDISAA